MRRESRETVSFTHCFCLYNNDHLIDATLPVQKNPYPHEHIEMQYRKLETHVKNQLNSYYKCATTYVSHVWLHFQVPLSVPILQSTALYSIDKSADNHITPEHLYDRLGIERRSFLPLHTIPKHRYLPDYLCTQPQLSNIPTNVLSKVKVDIHLSSQNLFICPNDSTFSFSTLNPFV